MHFRLSLTLAVLAIAFSSTAQAATITVPAGGNISAAYSQAQSGCVDTIQLSAGTYPRWITPNGSKCVTVKGAPNFATHLPNIDVMASNLTLDGLDLNAQGAVNPLPIPIYVPDEGDNLLLKNSRVGNIKDRMPAMIAGGSNVTFDNVVFHDAILRSESSDVHMECLWSAGPNVTIKNSRFENCAIMNVLFTRTAGQGNYGGVTILNTFFDVPRRANSQGQHFYGEYFGELGVGNRIVDRATIRGNTFNGSIVAPGNRFTNSVESCNTGSMDLPGITHETCGAPPPPPADRDGDGFPDGSDLCPDVSGQAPDGCPPPSPVYHPSCEPTCDQQIATLQSQVQTLTSERDAARALAQARLELLNRIRALLDE